MRMTSRAGSSKTKAMQIRDGLASSPRRGISIRLARGPWVLLFALGFQVVSCGLIVGIGEHPLRDDESERDGGAEAGADVAEAGGDVAEAGGDMSEAGADVSE